MKKIYSLFFMLFLIFSCRQESILQNISKPQSNDNLRFVKLKDIPAVKLFILQESQRKDLKISFPSVSSFKSKDQILADIETTYIVQVTKGDNVYTVFHINNIEDNDIIYN